MLTVNSQDELNAIRGPVLCKFGATWCTPCRDLEIKLLELEKAFKKTCTFVSIDVDEAEALCARHGIKQIPHVKMIISGEELMSCVNPTHDEIETKLHALQTTPMQESIA